MMESTQRTRELKEAVYRALCEKSNDPALCEVLSRRLRDIRDEIRRLTVR